MNQVVKAVQARNIVPGTIAGGSHGAKADEALVHGALVGILASWLTRETSAPTANTPIRVKGSDRKRAARVRRFVRGERI